MITFIARRVGNQPHVEITADNEEHLLQSFYLRQRFYNKELSIRDGIVYCNFGNEHAYIGRIISIEETT